jgi:hypothetical protein
MYTSIVLVALASSVAASYPQDALTWQKDYAQARTVGQTENKPLAVFFGSGAKGFDKTSQEGQLSTALQKLLADDYICVYVDVSTPMGAKLAESFGITKGTGLVLSNRTGKLQAFFHDGDLSDADLTRWVKHFANPNVVVNTTKTNTSSQVSFYPPEGNGANGTSAGNIGGYVSGYTYGQVPYYQPTWHGGGGGCAGGRCGR